MEKNLLGDLLLENGEISQEQLTQALSIQKKEGGLLGIILKKKGFISEKKLIEYLTLQANRRISDANNLDDLDSI